MSAPRVIVLMAPDEVRPCFEAISVPRDWDAGDIDRYLNSRSEDWDYASVVEVRDPEDVS